MQRFVAHIFVLTFTFLLLPNARAADKTIPAPEATHPTPLKAINEDLLDTTVEVEATVMSITAPREGSKAPFRINLSEATNSITLVVWPEVFDVIKARSPIEAGTTIHAHARVSKYRDNLQLQVQSASDLSIIAPPAEIPAGPDGITPVSKVTTVLMGRDLTLKATITGVRPSPEGSKAPYIVTLSQEGASIPLVFWSDMEPQLKPGLKVGNVVRVKAQVNEYHGTLQMKLLKAADFSVVSAAK